MTTTQLPMKLWHLKGIADTVDWDVIRALVIIAPSEYQARQLAHESGRNEITTRFGHSDYWLNPEFSSCRELVASGWTRVICTDASYG